MIANYALLAAAALCFAVGGLFMKWSAGLTQPAPVAAFLMLFVVGALAQAFAMRRTAMGAVYIAVLGLEAVAALFLSAVVLKEPLSWTRAFAILLVLTGVSMLRI